MIDNESSSHQSSFLTPTERIINDHESILPRASFDDVKEANDRQDNPELRELQREMSQSTKEAIINMLSDEYGLFLTLKDRESLNSTEPGLGYSNLKPGRTSTNIDPRDFKPYLHLEGDFSKVTDKIEVPPMITEDSPIILKKDGSIGLIRLTGDQTIRAVTNLYQHYGEEFKTYLSDLLWKQLKNMRGGDNSQPAYRAATEFLQSIDLFFDKLNSANIVEE